MSKQTGASVQVEKGTYTLNPRDQLTQVLKQTGAVG
jgi:hypothetical protein